MEDENIHKDETPQKRETSRIKFAGLKPPNIIHALLQKPTNEGSSHDVYHPGTHQVIIENVRYATNSNGELLATQFGKCGVEFTFINYSAKPIKGIVWLTKSSKWIFKEFCKAVNLNYSDVEDLFRNTDLEKVKARVDQSKEISLFKKAILKSLFIIVAEHLYISGGETLRETVWNPKGGFYPDTKNLRSVFLDEPHRNNGVCSGVFSISKKSETIETDIEDSVNKFEEHEEDEVIEPSYNINSWSCEYCGGDETTGCLMLKQDRSCILESMDSSFSADSPFDA